MQRAYLKEATPRYEYETNTLTTINPTRKMNVKRTTEVDVLYFYELNDEQARQAVDLYGTEEVAAEHAYVQAWDMLLSLENFTKINDKDWHASTHLTNTSGLVIRLSECGTTATIGLVY